MEVIESFVQATVESMLFYSVERKYDMYDGIYKRMFMSIFGASWKEFKSNKDFYGKLQNVMESLRIRRHQFF